MSTAVTEPKYKLEPGWQSDDLQSLYEREWSANWSEMGCYKTSTGLWLVAQQMKDTKKENPSVLIITSKSGKGTFMQMIPELEEYNEYKLLNVSTKGVSIIMKGQEFQLPGLEHIPETVTFPNVVLAHYDIFARCNKGVPLEDKETGLPVKDENGSLVMKEWNQADYLLERPWDYIWCDEAHRLKNRNGKWVVNIKKLKAPLKHISTGTGFINRPDEIWSLLNFLNKKEFGGYWSFRDEYCLQDTFSGYNTVIGIRPDKKDDFRKLVRTVGVRRTLTEVMPHIKEPIFVKREVELTPIQRKIFNAIKTELQALDQNGVPFNSPNVLAALSRLRQVCVATPEVISDEFDSYKQRRILEIRLVEPSSKLDALMEVINELQWDEDDKQPLVVFSNFVDPLNLLKTRFEKADIPYIWMKQKDNDTERYQKWAVEFPKLQHRVFMATLQLGSESINLTPAHHVVFLDRSWSPKDNSQGIGRIRRPGQEGQPVVVNIEALDTTDARIEHVNNIKGGWFAEVFRNDPA